MESIYIHLSTHLLISIFTYRANIRHTTDILLCGWGWGWGWWWSWNRESWKFTKINKRCKNTENRRPHPTPVNITLPWTPPPLNLAVHRA